MFEMMEMSINYLFVSIILFYEKEDSNLFFAFHFNGMKSYETGGERSKNGYSSKIISEYVRILDGMHKGEVYFVMITASHKRFQCNYSL